MLELLDTKKNWSKISGNSGGVFFKSIAAQPKLSFASGINSLTSTVLTSGKGAYSGKTFNAKRK